MRLSPRVKSSHSATCDAGGTAAAEGVQLVHAGASVLTRLAQAFVDFRLTVAPWESRGQRQHADGVIPNKNELFFFPFHKDTVK